MIKVENIQTFGFEGAIRGMRNPMNSWKLSDSVVDGDFFAIGDKDMLLAKKLFAGGPVHAKYLRMIHIQMDITAPLYWWKEFDTYKVGTTANSCSTMHKIHSRDFTIDDFSHEHLNNLSLRVLETNINLLNACRKEFNILGDKTYWWQMIQLLPSSYNQKRTIDFNYQTALEMIKWRENHKLDEWREFVKVLKSLPYIADLLEKD